MIDAYLRELEQMLRLPRRSRRRVVAEVRDHLLLASERDGERAALATFGDARSLALSFTEELAAAHSRPVVWAALAATALLGFALSPVGLLAVQVAATCAVLTALRTLRHRRDPALPAGKLRYVNRGNGAALAAAAVGAAFGLPQPPAVAALIAAAFGALGLARSVRHTTALVRLADDPTQDDAVEDVLAFVEAVPLAHSVARWIRAHPWRLCALVAVSAGSAAAAWHGISEGPAPTVGPTLEAGAILLAVEGGAVVACYTVLRRWLGLAVTTSESRSTP